MKKMQRLMYGIVVASMYANPALAAPVSSAQIASANTQLRFFPLSTARNYHTFERSQNLPWENAARKTAPKAQVPMVTSDQAQHILDVFAPSEHRWRR